MQDSTTPSSLSSVPRTQWFWIIVGCVVSSSMPWKYGFILSAIILAGYCLCQPVKWSRLQTSLIYIYGGLTIGLGIAFFIHYDMAGKTLPMLVVPLVVWVASSIIFHSLENFYALYALPENKKVDDRVSDVKHDSNMVKGASAWSGETTGKADDINADGYYMGWQFNPSGEIAMGGPTYGDVIFTNNCAFSHVGPSVAISKHGRYAALTQPSRQNWGLLLVDLDQKRVCIAKRDYHLWEIDHIDEQYIYGRHSPLTSDAMLKVSVEDFIRDNPCQDMIHDDGWWLMNDEGRTPLPRYPAISHLSDDKQHKALFVPILEPFRKNPFLRYSPPFYQLLIDDVLQSDYQTQQTEAHWINGKTASEQARFLLLETTVLDCMPNADLKFCVASPLQYSLNWQHDVPYLHFDSYMRSSNGIAQLRFLKMPRSYGWDEAITSSRGYSYPTDSEQVNYWDQDHQQRSELRQNAQQWLIIEAELGSLATHSIHEMPIVLTAPAQTAQSTGSLLPIHTIRLLSMPTLAEQSVYKKYGCYRTTLPWGKSLVNLTAEFKWSPCGRYLALLQEVELLFHQIIIVDFELQQIKTVPGYYALASFIWLDQDKIELTYQIDEGNYKHIILFGSDFTQSVAQPPFKLDDGYD